MTAKNEHSRHCARFTASEQWQRRAARSIPLGTQTFSKSFQQFPQGYSPLFLDRGKGGRVWDLDGNRFVDLICGLLPVVLGYKDTDVDQAILEQLDKGITFSLASKLEAQLAERLVDLIPCAEMVRFGKNGTDATSGAIRLARAHTSKNHVLAVGYHGWQDWYIGATTRNLGVPDEIQRLTRKVPYNDLSAIATAFREVDDDVAAVIMEPMNTDEPHDGYLEELASFVKKHGTLLIFDEVITGFRYSNGGAQELFGVTPDLACFGKALGNGMPISALVGRTDIMQLMSQVFYSSTFGGETLSLAAAIAVVDKFKSEPVVDRLWSTGELMTSHAEKAINEFDLEDSIQLLGKPPWKIFAVKDHSHGSKEAIKTLLLKGMIESGVLTGGAQNICYAHNNEDIKTVATAYHNTMGLISEALSRPGLDERLDCPPVMPVFAVR